MSVKRRCLYIGILTLLCVFLAIPAMAEVSKNLQVTRTYNSKGKVTSLVYVDQDRNPVVATDLGYAEVRYTYSGQTTLVKTAYYDEQGNPANCVQGYHSLTLTYTSKRKLAERAYKDKDGNYVIGPEGYAREVSDYWGVFVNETKHLDAEGNLICPEGLWARYVPKYISLGTGRTKVGDAYYDAEGNLIITSKYNQDKEALPTENP